MVSHKFGRLLALAAIGLVWAAIGATGAYAADSDGDGMPNRWEIAHNLNPQVANGRKDADHDGLRNLGEYRNRTAPHREDTDLDGIDDGDEVHVFASDPTDADEDSDGVLDGDEDFDGDGIANEDEDDALESCLADDDDADADGLANEDEDDFGTDAEDADSDDDGVIDGLEDNDGDGIADEDEDDDAQDACATAAEDGNSQ
jgi:hypothetical protein